LESEIKIKNYILNWRVTEIMRAYHSVTRVTQVRRPWYNDTQVLTERSKIKRIGLRSYTIVYGLRYRYKSRFDNN